MKTLQIRDKGAITLPAKYRKQYGLDKGEILTMIDMGNGVIMLLPKHSEVDRLANKIARQFKEANVTLEDMLETLDEERRRYYEEHYAKE